MSDLWWTKWHSKHFCPTTSLSPVSTILPMFHTHLHLNTVPIRRTSVRSSASTDQKHIFTFFSGFRGGGCLDICGPSCDPVASKHILPPPPPKKKFIAPTKMSADKHRSSRNPTYSLIYHNVCVYVICTYMSVSLRRNGSDENPHHSHITQVSWITSKLFWCRCAA